MGGRLAVFSLIVLLALGAPASPGSTSEGPVLVPSEDVPPAVAALGPLDGLLAFAVSSDGLSAAAASRMPGDPVRSNLQLVAAEGGEPETFELPGVARALLFSPDGDVLYAILHKPRKKSPGVASLFWIETESLRTSKGLLLPPSATALALWPEQGSLLVACADEIRTFSLPDLTSGPLFLVQGENLALAPLGARDLLVGRPEGVVLVNLDDTQGRDGLEPRERAEAGEAVTGLAAAPDGSAALARLSGGRVYRVALRPLRIEEEGKTALAVAWLGRPSPSVPAASRARREEGTARPDTVVAPKDEHKGVVTPETPREPTHAPAEPVSEKPHEPEPASPAEAEPTAAPAAVEGEPPTAAPAESSPPAVAAPPEPPPSPSLPAGLGGARGRISGPEAAKVAAVVLFGPDNLLRTALRVKPSAEGAWSAEGLTPGLYRILLAGEEGRVVASEPPYRTVRVEAGRMTAVPEIGASRVY